jgi:hypothetical protein
MNPSNNPKSDELPSSKQLLKSTFIAFLVATLVLIIAVLPAEYGIDPTGLGKSLGLQKMGEIKTKLATESLNPPTSPQANTAVIESLKIQQPLDSIKKDSLNSESFSYTLKPGQAIEIKLRMKKGSIVKYSWSTEDGNLNFDLHGDGTQGSKNFISYKKGLGVKSDQGIFTAEFDGKHGWFWRNRDKQDVSVTLKVDGEFSALIKYL